MTIEQINEIDACIPLLNKCREHINKVLFGGLNLSDSELSKLRRIYDKICSVLDEY